VCEKRVGERVVLYIARRGCIGLCPLAALNQRELAEVLFHPR